MIKRLVTLVTSLYSHDIILVLFQWIIKQDYKEKIRPWRLEPSYTTLDAAVLRQLSNIPYHKNLLKRKRPSVYIYRKVNFSGVSLRRLLPKSPIAPK